MGTPVKFTDLPSASALGGTEIVAGKQGTSGSYGGNAKILISQIGTYVRALFTTTPATIAEGGTGAATAAAARSTLGFTDPILDKTAPGAIGATTPAAISATTGTFAGLIDASAAGAGQLKFPAAQNASSNANTLDDYEEGTWTPAVGGSATYISQSGTYTKIGRRVFVNGYLAINVIGTGGVNQILGLPFTVGTPDNFAGSVTQWGSLTVSPVFLSVLGSSGSTTMNIVGLTAGSANLASSLNCLGNSSVIGFSLSYDT